MAEYTAAQAPPPEARGALGEIATGVKKGAMVDLPNMAGQALKAAGANNVGQSMVDAAQARAQQENYTLHPEQHNAVTNALAEGGSMVPTVGALGAVNMIPVVGSGLAAAGGAALFGGSTYQDTYEKAKAAGQTDAAAHAAGLKAGAIMGVGGALLQGVAGRALGGVVGKAAAEGFEAPAAQAAKGLAMPALKAAGTTAAEATAVNAAQTYGVRQVEQNAGIDLQGPSPGEAALATIAPSLGFSAFLGPFAAFHAYAGQAKVTGALSAINDTTRDASARMQAVNDTAPMIAAAPPKGADPVAWKNQINDWRLAALDAAANKGQIDLSPMYSSEWAGRKAAIEQATAQATGTDQPLQPALPAPAKMLALPPPEPKVEEPLGRGEVPPAEPLKGIESQTNPNPIIMGSRGSDLTRSITDQQAKFPQERAPATAPAAPELPPEARVASVMEGITTQERAQKAKQDAKATDELHGQVKGALTAAGLTPEEPKSFAAFSKDYRKTAFQPTQDQIKQAYAEHQRDVMRKNADTLEAHENKPPEPAPVDKTPSAPEPKTAEQGARERAAAPVANNQLGAKLTHELGKQQAKRERQAQLDQMAAQAEHSRQLERDAQAQPDGRGYNAQHLGQLFDEHTQGADLGLKGQARGKAKLLLDEAAKKPLLADQIKSLEAAREKLGKAQATRDAIDSFINHLKGSDHVSTEDAQAVREGTEHQPAAGEAGRAPAGGRVEGNERARAAEPDGKGQAPDAIGRPGSKAEPVREKVAPKAEAKPEPAPAAEAKPKFVEKPAEEGEHPAVARAQDTRDTLDATVAGFKDRLKAGEKLTDAERQRMEEAGTLRTRINELVRKLEEAGNAPDDKANAHRRAAQDAREEHLEALLDYARETEKPWTETRQFFEGDPSARSNRVMMALMRNTNVHDMLGDLAKMSQSPWVRMVAQRLHAMGLDASLHYGPEIPGANPRALGLATDRADGNRTVHIRVGGESEHVVLHEIVHIASSRMIALARSITNPKNQREAQLKQAYQRLEQIRKELRERFAPEQKDENGKTMPVTDAKLYGLTNADEFIAELNTNKKFQDFLRANGDGPQSIWQRVLQAIDGLLGTKLGGHTNYLDEALSMQGEYFRNQDAPLREGDISHAFETSTGAAAKAIDDGLSRVFAGVEAVVPKGSFKEGKTSLNKALLYLSSKNHIADMAARVQAFKGKGGFAEHVDKVRTTDRIQQEVQQHTLAQPGKFAMGLDRRLSGLKAADRRAVESEMGAIAKMASSYNIDPSKNFAGNQKANKALDPKLKAIVDEIHGRYTTFAKAHPEYSADIQKGAQLGRKAFTNQMATMVRNVLHMTAGRMEEREARVNDAGKALAEAHAKGKGIDAAQRELDEAKQALEHAKTTADVLTKHDLGLDIRDTTLAAAGEQRFKDAMAAAKTPEDRAAAQAIRDQHADAEAYAMHQRVQDLFQAANELPQGHPLKAGLAAFQKGYQSQIDNPYLHLGRKGDYYARGATANLNAQDKAKVDAVFAKYGLVAADLGRTEDHAYARFNTQEEVNGFHRDMAAALGDKYKDPEGGLAVVNHTLDTKGGVADALRQLSLDHNKTFGDVDGLTDSQRAQIKDSFTQQLLSLLPESSAAKSSMMRKGTPGYDAEFVRSFAKRAYEISRQTSAAYTVRGYTDAFRAMHDSVQEFAKTDIPHQVQARQIANELGERHANDMKPNGSSVISTITGFGFHYYLGASPAFVIRNALQPWHLGLPMIGSRYGMVKTAKAMAVATGQAYKILNATIKQGLAGNDWREVLTAGLKFDGLGLSEGQQRMMQLMLDRGVINSGQTHQINDLLGKVGQSAAKDMVRATGMFADYSEKINRIAIGLTAYKMAGGDANFEAAAQYAMKQVEDIMINYEGHNTSRAMGSHGVLNAATPLISQFAKYNFGVMEMVHNLMHDALGQQHDGTPEGKAAAKQAQKEAVKTMAGLAATTTMLAGVMGLPFVSAFAGIYNMLTKDKDDPSDVRIEIQSWLAKTFGKGVGEVISHGLPRAAGVDFSTIGLADILPGSGMLADRAPLQDMLANQSQEMMGPALNGGMNVAVGLHKMSDGYYLKGLEQLLPTALKNLAKAYDTSQNGFTDSKGNPIAAKATPIDSVIQAFGLRPAAKAVSDEQNAAFSADAKLREHRRDVIADHLYKAYQSKDADEIKSWEAQRAAYNGKNPTEPIKKIDAFRSNARGLALAQQTGTGIKMTGKQAADKGPRYAIGNVGN